jgi:hypothetical protein
VPDLACVAALLDGADAIFERRLRVDAVEVVEVDRLRAQPPQALLDLAPDRLGAPIVPAALRRDEPIVASLWPPA